MPPPRGPAPLYARGPVVGIAVLKSARNFWLINITHPTATTRPPGGRNSPGQQGVIQAELKATRGPQAPERSTQMADGNNELDLSAFGIEGPLRVGRGAKASGKLAVTGTRSLAMEDLMAAATKPTEPNPGVKQLRQSHHQLAKLLAQGLKQVDIASITGFSMSRISVLKSDPQFAELLSYYQEMEAEGWQNARADMRERLLSLGFDSIETLHSRLEEDPEGFSNDALLKLVELTTDRTGHGKVTKLEGRMTHAIDDATLARIRNSASAAPAERNISPEDRRALIGLVHDQTRVHPSAETIDGEATSRAWVREEGGEGTS